MSSLAVVANCLTVAAVACSPGKLIMHKKLISLAVLDCCIAVDFLIYSIVEILSSLDIEVLNRFLCHIHPARLAIWTLYTDSKKEIKN